MWTNRSQPEVIPCTLNTVTAPESLRFYETSAETGVAMNGLMSQTLSEQQSPDLLGCWERRKCQPVSDISGVVTDGQVLTASLFAGGISASAGGRAPLHPSSGPTG